MNQVLHVSAECYPAAKAGGLADVVGSLPKYMSAAGVPAAVVMPRYGLPWMYARRWQTVHVGAVRVDWRHVGYSVQLLESDELGFPLYAVDIPGLFDRPGIYNDPPSGTPYGDEVERYLTFQQAVLQWLLSMPMAQRPRVLHCHDHHTGLIPFMVKYCPEYKPLGEIPTVFTIHNGQYQGRFSWNNVYLMPFFDSWGRGILDWQGVINPMAAAIKCAWAVTTVSRSYLYELHDSSLGLEPLFRSEWAKQHGILNGIDTHVWDPKTDSRIWARLENNDVEQFKANNKRALCEAYGLDERLPLVSFISRMVHEKGADLLPDAYRRILHSGEKVSFFVLGTGDKRVEDEFRSMAWHYRTRFNAALEYNETVSHQIYAGSDFLIMPSRIEPCGLNQMYAMRYGTIPIVRAVGGLKDTVPDLEDKTTPGRGIRFDQFTVDDVQQAVHRAVSMYFNSPDVFRAVRDQIMQIDFSWEHTVDIYFQVYKLIGAYLQNIKPDAGNKPETPKIQVTAQTPMAPVAVPHHTEPQTPAVPAKTPVSRKRTSKKQV
ncbi:MAG: glycogen/starch synthase [Saprospiraceae bacterium]|nr:glycogen/starch synthase [Saprospiraceae bacterium]